jgi:hypothetical protein
VFLTQKSDVFPRKICYFGSFPGGCPSFGGVSAPPGGIGPSLAGILAGVCPPQYVVDMIFLVIDKLRLTRGEHQSRFWKKREININRRF